MSVPDGVLVSALTEALGPVAALRRAPSPWASTAVLEDLAVRLADGSVRRLVLKHGGRATAREVRVYRDVLAAVELGTPAYVAGCAAGPGWLVLSTAPGSPLWQQAGVAAWCDAARWLRRAHEVLAGAQVLPHQPVVGDRARLDRAVAREPRAATLTSAYWSALDLLAAQPRTLVHGEAFPGNLLVAPEGVCAVDWEGAFTGCGLLDLAALTAGWDPAGVDAITEAYGAAGPAVVAARLVVAVQWLGEPTPSAQAGGGRAAATDWWSLAEQAAA